MHLEYFKNEILPLKQKLFRYARYYFKNEQQAEDIVQEVFLKLWNKREEFDKINNIEAWCMTVTKHLVLDNLKTNRHYQIYLNKNDVDDRTPEIIIERKETTEEVRNMIESLPAKQKEVIILRELEGYTYQEIGDIIGIDQNLVKVTLFRARENLRKKILKTDRYGL